MSAETLEWQAIIDRLVAERDAAEADADRLADSLADTWPGIVGGEYPISIVPAHARATAAIDAHANAIAKRGQR